MTDKKKPRVRPDGASRPERPGIPDLPDLSEVPDNEIANRDHGGPYIPGYSEEEAARDVRDGVLFGSGSDIHGLSEADKREHYERFGVEPKPKDVDLKFLRVTGRNMEESNSNVQNRLISWQRDGYTPVRKSDFEDGGRFKDYGVPPDAEIMADGTIRRMDTALFAKPVDADDLDSASDDEGDRVRDSLRGEIPEDRIIVEEEEGSRAASFPK